MSERNQLEQLIIKNLSIIEKANEIIPEIHQKVFTKIDELVKKWTDDQDNWTGKFDFAKKYELYFNPKSWVKEDNNYSCFNLGYYGKSDYKYISFLCGVALPKSENHMAFYWSFPYKELGKKAKREWKVQLNDLFSKY